MSQDILELVSIVVSPMLPQLFAIMVLFILIVSVKLYSFNKE